MKISFILSQHSLQFLSIQKLCIKNLNSTIRFGYNLRFKKWLLDFALSKAWAGKINKKIKKSQENKQFASRLDKFS